MEPRIQYAKTEDGVNIAYSTMGAGMPFVRTARIPWSHLQVEIEIPKARRWAENIAGSYKSIRYDARGAGLSDEEQADYSLDGHIHDLEAVVDQEELDRFVLYASRSSGPIAIEYAARHPERVSHLVLFCSSARNADLLPTTRRLALEGLRETDWKLYVKTLLSEAFGWKGEALEPYMGISRTITPERLEQIEAFDASNAVGVLKMPALVIFRRDVPISFEPSRWLVSSILDSSLAMLEGDQAALHLGDSDAVLKVINAFTGVTEGLQEADVREKPSGLPEGMTAILFLDIADSTALTTKLGDAAYRERERELDASTRAAITEAGGTPVEGKVLGDGVMAVFTSARQAIDAAQRCRDLGNEAGLPLHLGIHAGDVVREANNVHGGAVQVASRVQGVADVGEILVSATVRDLARTSAGVEFEDRGDHELKGIAEPRRLFAAREQN